MLDQQPFDLGLLLTGFRCPAAFPDVNDLGFDSQMGQHRPVHQSVEQDHVGLLEDLLRPYGQQAGVAWAGADEVHHAGRHLRAMRRSARLRVRTRDQSLGDLIPQCPRPGRRSPGVDRDDDVALPVNGRHPRSRSLSVVRPYTEDPVRLGVRRDLRVHGGLVGAGVHHPDAVEVAGVVRSGRDSQPAGRSHRRDLVTDHRGDDEDPGTGVGKGPRPSRRHRTGADNKNRLVLEAQQQRIAWVHAQR